MRRSTLLVLLPALCMACEIPEGPRELPAPRLDPVSVFRGADAEEGPTGGDPGDGAGSSFEARIRQRARPSARQETGVEDTTVAVQRVVVGELVAELPQRREGWIWGRDGDLTLMVHGGTTGAPDALVLAQGYEREVAHGPAQAANHFYLGVDPTLANRWVGLGSSLSPLATQLAARLPLTTLETLEALHMLLTPTIGRGLGFTPLADSFSGWKWTGLNDHHTLLRFARSRGSWGAQDGLSRNVELVAEAVAGPGDRLGALLWQEPPSGTDETPALLLLGSAERDDGRGVHLALLCRTVPECPLVEDLAAFLDSLRPPDGPSTGDRDRGQRLKEVTRAAGITLLAGNDLPDPADLRRSVTAALRRAPSRADPGAAQSPGAGTSSGTITELPEPSEPTP